MLDVLVHCYLVINDVHEYLYKLCSQTHTRVFGNQATRYIDLSSLKIVIWFPLTIHMYRSRTCVYDRYLRRWAMFAHLVSPDLGVSRRYL